MKFQAFLRHFYHHYLVPEFGIKCQLAGIILLLGSTLLVINSIFFHYSGVMQLGDFFIRLMPAFLLLFAVGLYIQKESPRIAVILRAASELFFVALLIQFYVAMVQYTPFPLQDHFFHRLDVWLGYDTAAVLSWIRQHGQIFWLFDFVYTKLYFELILVPLALAVFMLRRQLDIFLLANLWAALLGFTIYYFFPTTDPAAVVHHAKFYPTQEIIISQFMQLHRHQPITHYVGGIVGFPSFHVIWALITLYSVRKLKLMFSVILLLNTLIIGSTFLLAWHFLSDVLGGFLVAALSIYLAEKFSKAQDQRALSRF